jgi:hypothetical protein
LKRKGLIDKEELLLKLITIRIFGKWKLKGFKI